jgi:hypothetical protein
MAAHRRRRRRGRYLAGVAAVTLIGCVPAPAPGPVIVYGDSLTLEAAPYLQGLVVRARGGTAPCDWWWSMPYDAAHYQPRRVLVAFTGNLITPCTARWADRLTAYRAMLAELARRWPSTPVTLIGGPDSTTGTYPYTAAIRQLVAVTAFEHRWGYADASRALAGLPRAADGFHLTGPSAVAYAQLITSAARA